ncbi:MAG TPA: hypothetical protein VKR62_02885, partial [Roseiarcus sp.]|nr:hypothetical protein [Roseiarcus sp.]
SLDIWVASHPSTSTSPHVGNPTAGQTYDVWVEVHNQADVSLSTPELPWLLTAVWAIPTAGPIPLASLTSANNLNSTALGVVGAGDKVKVRCMNSWTPVFENGGHECLIAWTNSSNIPYPTEPSLDGNAGPGDWYSIAQHNLGVLAAGSSKRHPIRYAFQVCNGADEEGAFVVSARQAPLEAIEAFLPSMPGGRAILDKPGKVERLGIVASADPSAVELERAPAELSVKIARQSCRRFTLAGVLPEGNALIHVTQSRDQRVVGGLSVLAMAEERK